MSSTKHPCYGAVHIPGIPGIFANSIVEVDDATHEVLGITALDGSPLPDPDTSPQSPTPEAAPASSDSPKE